MTEQELRLALITGSAREGRFGDVVTRWLEQQVARSGLFRQERVDLRLLDLDSAAGRRELLGRLSPADAFLVVTPEYNHGYPAPLKAAIDIGYREWHAKPVAFVSYGGISGGLRAVEQLRQVFAELHAATIRDGVSFHRVEAQFDAAGRPRHAEAVDAAARLMLDELEWWARALQVARQTRPYAFAHPHRGEAVQADAKAEPVLPDEPS